MSNEKKTIGIFLHALHYGGIEKFVETHLSVYNPSFNDCHIVVNRTGDEAQIRYFEDLGFEIHCVPMKSPKSVSLSACRAYGKLFEDVRFDIVHSNLPTNILPLLYAKKNGVPRKVIHSHSNYLLAIENKPAIVQRIYRSVMQGNAARADACLACSEQAAEVFGASAGRTRIINNSIDFNAFRFDSCKRAIVRANLGIDDGSTVFCHVGRMENEIKNHRFLLRVFRAYKGKDVHARLILVGDGKKRLEFEQCAKDLGIADACFFVGTTNHVEEYLNASDMFLFPSKSEGLGISLVEAQATGVPCVASDRVPARAKFMDNVMFAPIDKGEAPWIEAIEMLLPDGRAVVDEGTMTRSGYSIEASSAILCDALGLSEA